MRKKSVERCKAEAMARGAGQQQADLRRQRDTVRVGEGEARNNQRW